MLDIFSLAIVAIWSPMISSVAPSISGTEPRPLVVDHNWERNNPVTIYIQMRKSMEQAAVQRSVLPFCWTPARVRRFSERSLRRGGPACWWWFVGDVPASTDVERESEYSILVFFHLKYFWEFDNLPVLYRDSSATFVPSKGSIKITVQAWYQCYLKEEIWPAFTFWPSSFLQIRILKSPRRLSNTGESIQGFLCSLHWKSLPRSGDNPIGNLLHISVQVYLLDLYLVFRECNTRKTRI